MRLTATILSAVLFALAGPVVADPVPGTEDPAFALPFARLLQGDDPDAVAALHAAAEAGSLPALLALPAALTWVPPTGPLPERNRLRRVNGTPLPEAVAAALPEMAVWAGGEASADRDALLRRAMALAGAGEPLKGGLLMGLWVNQTGGMAEAPPEIFDLPLPSYLLSLLPVGRRMHHGTLDGEPTAMLVSLIRRDHPAGWMALADLAADGGDGGTTDPARIEAIWRGAGVAADTAAARLADAMLANRRVRVSSAPPLSRGEAERVQAFLAGTGDLALLGPFCDTLCPKSAGACTTAAVAFGLEPLWTGGRDLPPSAVIAPEEFYATPRGRGLLLRQGAQLSAGAGGAERLGTARGIDACLARAIEGAAPP